jgi:hypothetical protein
MKKRVRIMGGNCLEFKAIMGGGKMVVIVFVEF